MTMLRAALREIDRMILIRSREQVAALMVVACGRAIDCIRLTNQRPCARSAISDHMGAIWRHIPMALHNRKTAAGAMKSHMLVIIVYALSNHQLKQQRAIPFRTPP